MKKIVLKICLILFVMLQVAPTFASVVYEENDNQTQIVEDCCQETNETHVHQHHNHSYSCSSHCFNMFMPSNHELFLYMSKEDHFKPKNQSVSAFLETGIKRPPRSL